MLFRSVTVLCSTPGASDKCFLNNCNPMSQTEQIFGVSFTYFRSRTKVMPRTISIWSQKSCHAFCTRVRNTTKSGLWLTSGGGSQCSTLAGRGIDGAERICIHSSSKKSTSGCVEWIFNPAIISCVIVSLPNLVYSHQDHL